MRNEDPENSSRADERNSGGGKRPGIPGTIDRDLDLLAGRLAELEARLAEQALAGSSETTGSEPAGHDDPAGQPDALPPDEPAKPDSSRQPRIIREGWARAEPAMQQNGCPDKNEDRLSSPQGFRDILERLRKHAGESAERIAELTAQAAKADGTGRAAPERYCAPGSRGQAEDPARALSSERETMVQSARARAYALHAAERYEDALGAYQDYFDLLGSASVDIASRRAGRECALQARRSRARSARRRIVLFLLLFLIGGWFAFILYLADRTVESARLADADDDLAALCVYCERLESTLFSAGSGGLSGFLYGPELSRWKQRINATVPASLIAAPVETGGCQASTAPAETLPVKDEKPTTVRAGDDGTADLPVREVSLVVTNYRIPPIVSFGLDPADTEAVVYNRDFEKMAVEHGITILEPGERYLLLAGRRGYELHSEPLVADWQSVKRIELSLQRYMSEVPRQKAASTLPAGADSGTGVYGDRLALEELFSIMEGYEKRLIRKRLRELRGRAP